MSNAIGFREGERVTARTFVVERFWPGVTPALAQEVAGRLTEAAAGFSREGRAVRYVGSVLLPADEVMVSVVEAAAPDVVRGVAARAGHAADRITESITIDGCEEADSDGK